MPALALLCCLSIKENFLILFVNRALGTCINLVAQEKSIRLPMPETRVRSPGQEDALENEMDTYSNSLAWGDRVNRGAWRTIDHGVTKESDRT